MVTKSSIKRKPLADLTNIVRKPNHISSFSQSKKPGSSTATDSSIGSTQNPINVHRPTIVPPDQPLPSKPQRLKPDHLVADENQIVHAQRHSTLNTRSKTKAAAPFHQTSFQETRNSGKQGSVSRCSSTLEKFKDQGKVNQSCLDKTENDGKKISVAPHYSSMEKIKGNRKSTDVPFSENNSMSTPIPLSTVKIKDKGKENVVQSNMCITMPDSLMKRKDKGKAIAMPLDYPSRKNLKNNMMEFHGPLKGVIIKDSEETAMGSNRVDFAQKDKGKTVVTPINYRILEKDKQSSCPPLLRTMSDRNEADGGEDISRSKLQTEPPPNKKKRRCSSKEVKEEYRLPQEYVEQQRAYFKEIDDFELQVEEV